MCTSARPLICIWLRPSPSSWWLATTLFWPSTVTATRQVPYFQTIMVFCHFVKAQDWIMVSSSTITFATCSRRLLVIFHPPVHVPHFLFSSLDWLSLLNFVTYLRVASIPWTISKALLNVKSLSNSNLLCVFPSFISHTILLHIIVSHDTSKLQSSNKRLRSATKFADGSSVFLAIYAVGQPRMVLVESYSLKLLLSLKTFCLTVYLRQINL